MPATVFTTKSYSALERTSVIDKEIPGESLASLPGPIASAHMCCGAADPSRVCEIPREERNQAPASPLTVNQERRRGNVGEHQRKAECILLDDR